MATSRKLYRTSVNFRLAHDGLDRPEFDAAMQRGLRRFAPVLESTARRLAQERIKSRSASVNNRGQRRYRNRMVDGYEVRFLAGGRTLSLRNRFLRGRIFEVGSSAHWIVPKRGLWLYWRNPKPAGPLVRKQRILHPGTRAQNVMRDTMRIEERLGERMIRAEIARVA